MTVGALKRIKRTGLLKIPSMEQPIAPTCSKIQAWSTLLRLYAYKSRKKCAILDNMSKMLLHARDFEQSERHSCSTLAFLSKTKSAAQSLTLRRKV
ncbi:MAG TPA: hypothetical protein PKA19_14575 [Bacillota bacterium]|nr:hypothetical protein [Bacillota bacterium]